MTETELYKTLLQKGVSDSYIKNIKQTLNMSEDPYKRYYDDIQEDKKTFAYVPVSKIKSLGFRGTVGLSWFDHACCNGTHNIDLVRCQRAFDYLKTQSLDEFHDYYKHHPVRLKYYEDDDFYVVFGDGTHRTLWAKVTGASYIYARIYRARKNHSTYESYRWFKELEVKFHEYLSSNELSLKGFRRNYSYRPDSTSEICYKGEYLGFYRIYSPDMFTDKTKLNMKTLHHWKLQQQDLKEEYVRVFKYRDKLHLLMKMMPNKWKGKIISFLEVWIDTIGSSDEKKQKQYDLRKMGFKMFCIDRKLSLINKEKEQEV